MGKDCLNVAVVGAGYWGKNLVCVFARAQRCRLKYVCDLDENILAAHKIDFPFINISTSFDVILCDAEVDADGTDGLRVVQILEAGQKSLRNDGIPVGIGDFECLGRKNILPTSQRISSSPAKSAKAPKSGIFHT